MRCLTIANLLRDRGALCRFICREHEGNLLNLIRTQGFEAIGLPLQELETCSVPEINTQPIAHAAWLGTDWITDAEQTKIAAGGATIDWLIVDHYALDARWEQALRSQCRKIMVIDDIADRSHDCDLLLDQNLFGDMSERYIGMVPEDCIQLLGPRYAVLQPQYADLHTRTPPRNGPVGSILVYFGGADTNNLTGLAVRAYLALGQNDVTLDVVINPSNPHRKSILRLIEGHTKISLHEGLASLAPLMAKADVAIGAGGTTSWERCCLGLPALVITLAANQVPIASELSRLGLIQWLGNSSEVSELTLVNELRNLCNTGLTREWSNRCRQTVDGFGAERVVSIMTLSSTTKLKARLARVDDETLFLRWANVRPDRENSLVSDSFDQRYCIELFHKCLRDLECCRLYVVETEDGLPIGSVRFYLCEKKWEIDYSIDAVARCNELGRALLKSAIYNFRASMSGILFLGRINITIHPFSNVVERIELKSDNHVGRGGLSIAICSDSNSWINSFIPELLLSWLLDGHFVVWGHSANELPEGDICFYLSYGRIVDSTTRSRFKNNLVVHESDLPKGRGWSPMTWLILSGESRIPVTLLEAVDQVDAGPIYLQDWIELMNHELSTEWRQLQAKATVRLCMSFVSEYPTILNKARIQEGEASLYPRRRPIDSEIDPHKSIAEQFNLLRVVDNKSYPAFFNLMGNRFVLHIESV